MRVAVNFRGYYSHYCEYRVTVMIPCRVRAFAMAGSTAGSRDSRVDRVTSPKTYLRVRALVR